MTERAHREGYAMHSVKAREQWVHPSHKLGGIRVTARTWRTARPVARDQVEGAAQNTPLRFFPLFILCAPGVLGGKISAVCSRARLSSHHPAHGAW
ncbi:MAG: hypothetical protein DDG58_03495, partial [Ardenticatenia bacterium]